MWGMVVSTSTHNSNCITVGSTFPQPIHIEYHLNIIWLPFKNLAKTFLISNSVEKGNGVDSGVVWFLQTWLWYSLLCLLLTILSSCSRLKLVLLSRPCSNGIVSRIFPDQSCPTLPAGSALSLYSVILYWAYLHHSIYRDRCCCLSYHDGCSLGIGTKPYSSWQSWCLTKGWLMNDGWNAPGTPQSSVWRQCVWLIYVWGKAKLEGAEWDLEIHVMVWGMT